MLGRLAVTVAMALALAVVPGAVVSRAAPTSGVTAPGPSTLATDALPVPTGSVATPLPAATPMTLALTLASSNASGLARFLAEVEAPGSPGYREFLTYPEFRQRYGPSPATVEQVLAAVRSYGPASAEVAPGGLAVQATMPAGEVGELLGVQPVAVRLGDGSVGFTVTGTPALPAALRGLVVGVDGLSDLGVGPQGPAVTELRAGPVATPAQFVKDSSSGEDWYFGTDYAQAYEATDLLPGSRSVTGATYPTGVAVATLLASGYNSSTSTVLPPWQPSVVDAYFNQTFPAGWPHPTVEGVPVTIGGTPAPPAPGAPAGGLNDSIGFVTENSLDLEMAGSLAPGAHLYNFYFSGGLAANPATAGNAPIYLSDDLGDALNYSGYGGAHLAVVSGSFGLADLNSSLWDAYLAAAAATGVTLVASSGDQGDAPASLTGRGTPWPLWPATAAFNTSGAVSVGGVTVSLVGTATSTFTNPPLNAAYDPNVEGIAGTSVWWDTTGGQGHYAGSEGGTSLTYPEPWWQFHSAAQWPIVNATRLEGFPQLGRAGPDVAFPANTTITFVAATSNGTPLFEVVEGTSVAAPVFAGLLADVVAVENATIGGITGLGFIDPEIYRMASYFQATPGAQDPFLPVVVGHNGFFTAAAGWDPATGWGGLTGPAFLAADENSTIADYNYTGPTPTLSTHSPSSSPPTDLIVLVAVAAAAAVLSASYIVVSRRSRRAVPPVAPAMWNVTPPSDPRLGAYRAGPVATFACPYCGRERPAEPGHCPSCGAM